ncbi:MAG: DUF5676 family membrane protein [Candidatus Curtissbacteria bacterium]|nr:DUF5676 family membrane protein [Candidatus Curtissbacteria bacterium]
MLKSLAFANAATVVVAVFYAICAFLSYVMPDLLVAIATSWVHSLSLEVLKATGSMSIVSLVIGLVTISALTWITTYVFAEVYNRFAK